jgi:hypothetical protein
MSPRVLTTVLTALMSLEASAQQSATPPAPPFVVRRAGRASSDGEDSTSRRLHPVG